MKYGRYKKWTKQGSEWTTEHDGALYRAIRRQVAYSLGVAWSWGDPKKAEYYVLQRWQPSKDRVLLDMGHAGDWEDVEHEPGIPVLAKTMRYLGLWFTEKDYEAKRK